MHFFRPRSLFARLVVSLGIVLVVSFGAGAWLSIHTGRAAIRSRAETELRGSAAGVLQGVEEYLAQRRTEVRVWAGLEVMDGLRAGDRDARLDAFLSHLQHEYGGTYSELLAVDLHGIVIASTRVEHAGKNLDPHALGIAAAPSPGDSVFEGRTSFDGRNVYAIASPVRSRRRGEMSGWFMAFADWRVVEQKISTASVAGDSQDDRAFLLLVDAKGNILAGRRDLAKRAGVGTEELSDAIRQGRPLHRAAASPAHILAWAGGTDRSASTRTWRLVAFHDTQRAFEVVDVFARGIWVAMLAGLLLAGVLSLWIARGVTRPVRGLVAATRRVASGDLEYRVPQSGVRDLRELAAAFNAMADDLADTRQRLEAAWRQEESVRVRSEFMNHVSHELRTPITAILSYTEILRDPSMSVQPHERTEFLGVIHAQSQRLMRLISDLLDTAKLEAGVFRCAFQNMPLASVVQTTVDALVNAADAKGVVFLTHVPNDLPLVYADPDRLAQVLTNLAGNAVKFTSDGGFVTITVTASATRCGARTEGSFVGIESHDPEKGPYVIVCVRDSGVGIAPEDQPKVFERFVQVGASAQSRRGAGLGLTIAASIVVQHGGAIWLESTPGEGSVFSFSIPVASAANPQHSVSAMA